MKQQSLKYGVNWQSVFNQNICDLKSGKNLLGIPGPDPGVKKHQIPDPDPQHWFFIQL